MNPLLVKLLAGVGIFLAGSITGAVIQGWRLDASHASDMAACNQRYHEIELRVEKQNGGINLMNYKLEVAEQAQKVAEANAAYVRNQYAIQNKKASEITATSCASMLESLKGIR